MAPWKIIFLWLTFKVLILTCILLPYRSWSMPGKTESKRISHHWRNPIEAISLKNPVWPIPHSPMSSIKGHGHNRSCEPDFSCSDIYPSSFINCVTPAKTDYLKTQESKLIFLIKSAFLAVLIIATKVIVKIWLRHLLKGLGKNCNHAISEGIVPQSPKQIPPPVSCDSASAPFTLGHSENPFFP